MNTIRTHVLYPPREPTPDIDAPHVRLPAKLNARIDDALRRGVPTKEIRAVLDVTNEDVQRRRHQMRRRGLRVVGDGEASSA